MNGILGHIESPKFSRIVRRAYYPPSRAHTGSGPIEDHAKAAIYRKALSLVCGFPISEIPELAEQAVAKPGPGQRQEVKQTTSERKTKTKTNKTKQNNNTSSSHWLLSWS